MPEKEELPRIVETRSFAFLHNEETGKWDKAWLKAYGRKECYEFSGGESFNCEAFEKFLLKIHFTAPTGTDRVKVAILFSYDNVDWYYYDTPPFDAMIWEEGTPHTSVCLSGACLDNYIKIELEEGDANFEITFTS